MNHHLIGLPLENKVLMFSSLNKILLGNAELRLHMAMHVNLWGHKQDAHAQNNSVGVYRSAAVISSTFWDLSSATLDVIMISM